MEGNRVVWGVSSWGTKGDALINQRTAEEQQQWGLRTRPASCEMF